MMTEYSRSHTYEQNFLYELQKKILARGNHDQICESNKFKSFLVFAIFICMRGLR